jgi:hypothetical protein
MDPYLEDPAFWSDFHASFITYWRDALAERLPDNYEVRIDERISLVDVPAEKIKRFGPDLAVSQRGPATAAPAAAGGVATLEPVTIPLRIEEEARETHIEILYRADRTLVAILELLSPSNKEEPGRAVYLTKHNALLYHPLHLVELDLLLKGQRLPLEEDYPPGDYFALVSRGDQRPNCSVYAWTMRQPLPAIPVPLRPPDPDLIIDLGAVFAVTYERGRYARSLDYAKPPPFALDDARRNWIAERLQAAAT